MKTLQEILSASFKKAVEDYVQQTPGKTFLEPEEVIEITSCMMGAAINLFRTSGGTQEDFVTWASESYALSVKLEGVN